MNLSKHEKICRHCCQPFRPDLRNRARQDYCYKPACRQARKLRSYRLWRARYPNHFKGDWNTDRVREWRKAHPGYSRRSKSRVKSATPQASDPPPSAEHHDPQPTLPLPNGVPPLPDSVRRHPLILGLIAHVFGAALQNSVEKVIGELIIKGMEIRAMLDGTKMNCSKSAKYDAQKTRVSRRPAPATGAGQTARSPAGTR